MRGVHYLLGALLLPPALHNHRHYYYHQDTTTGATTITTATEPLLHMGAHTTYGGHYSAVFVSRRRLAPPAVVVDSASSSVLGCRQRNHSHHSYPYSLEFQIMLLPMLLLPTTDPPIDLIASQFLHSSCLNRSNNLRASGRHLASAKCS